jgi:cytochrome P450
MRAPVESLSEELLLGVLAAGSMDLIAAYASTSGRARSWPAAPARTFCRVLPAIWKFVRYIRQVIAAKRAQLQDDLISALARRASGYARTSSSR